MLVKFTGALDVRPIAKSLSRIYGAEIVADTITVSGSPVAAQNGPRAIVNGRASLRLTVAQTAALIAAGAKVLTAKSITLPDAKRGRKPVASQTFASWLASQAKPAKSAPTAKRTTRPAKSAAPVSVDPSAAQ
jgi:hypothetical protein